RQDCIRHAERMGREHGDGVGRGAPWLVRLVQANELNLAGGIASRRGFSPDGASIQFDGGRVWARMGDPQHLAIAYCAGDIAPTTLSIRHIADGMAFGARVLEPGDRSSCRPLRFTSAVIYPGAIEAAVPIARDAPG